MMRSWTVLFLVLWLLSLAQLPMTFLLAEMLTSSQLTYAVSGILWQSGNFWLQVILATFVVTIPLYGWKIYKYLYREPQFLAVD